MRRFNSIPIVRKGKVNNVHVRDIVSDGRYGQPTLRRALRMEQILFDAEVEADLARGGCDND